MPIDYSSERGLFYVNTNAATGERANDGDTWKNLDELRLKDLAVFLVDPRPGMSVLEMGSGNGANMVYCGLQGATVYGQDLNEAAVAMANEKLADLGIDGKAVVGDATRLQFGDASVDAVLSSDFHEHLTADAQAAVLREAWRVLKPGGVLAVKTPNVAYLRASLWYKRLATVARGKDPRGIVIPHTPGTDDPQHIGLISRHRIAEQLADAGFHQQEFVYSPLLRFGRRPVMVVASTEIPVVRDVLCEDVLVRARKPIGLAHFPD